MARTKSTLASQQLTDELAELDRQRREILERRKQAVANEDTRRGEIIRKLLQGDSGRSLASLLHPLIPNADRVLFPVGKPSVGPGDDGDDGEGSEERADEKASERTPAVATP